MTLQSLVCLTWQHTAKRSSTDDSGTDNKHGLIGLELRSLAITSETPLKRAIQEYMSKRPEIAARFLNMERLFLIEFNIREVIETLELKIVAKRASQRVKRTSGARVMIIVGRSVYDTRYW